MSDAATHERQVVASEKFYRALVAACARSGTQPPPSINDLIARTASAAPYRQRPITHDAFVDEAKIAEEATSYMLSIPPRMRLRKLRQNSDAYKEYEEPLTNRALRAHRDRGERANRLNLAPCRFEP